MANNNEAFRDRFRHHMYILHKRMVLAELNKHTYARARLNLHPRIKNPDENILIVYEG